MAETTAEEFFPNDTYHGAWTVFWLLSALFGYLVWKSFFQPMPITAPPRAAISAGYDWFLVAHMPEIPKDTAKAEMMKGRFASWLDALAREGYQPMRLADAEERLHSGVGLPNRALVLVFDPGYDHTYEAISPILVQYRFPAVWVTDHTAFLRGDRRFIHRRKAEYMVRSGYWDLAMSGDGFWGHATDPHIMKINNSLDAAWAPGTGKKALNWGSHLAQLQRLDVSPKWTAQELVDRLAMEIPLEGTVRLGVQRIQGQWWGVIIDPPTEQKTFTFQAPLAHTASTLYWISTRGVQDAQVDLNIASFFGECFLWLRSDSKTGSGVGIGFTNKKIFVDQRVNGVRKRLMEVPWKPAHGTIQGRLFLNGSTLEAAMQGASPLAVSLLKDNASSDGLVRFQIYDRVRGAARADKIDLLLTPLNHKSQKS